MSKNRPVLGVSPITGVIFAGKTNKKGDRWLGEKYDVTTDAVRCVAEYLHTQNVHHEFEISGKKYKLSFEEVKKSEDATERQ